ncbi:hypothetical protein KBY99_13355 [Cyanobium sp. Maggiore-St4-Cus]|jgi:hypothetical protein|nr:hypothetical protein [Cyanobium sp. Maggiore-St4-Cus]
MSLTLLLRFPWGVLPLIGVSALVGLERGLLQLVVGNAPGIQSLGHRGASGISSTTQWPWMLRSCPSVFCSSWD